MAKQTVVTVFCACDTPRRDATQRVTCRAARAASTMRTNVANDSGSRAAGDARLAVRQGRAVAKQRQHRACYRPARRSRYNERREKEKENGFRTVAQNFAQNDSGFHGERTRRIVNVTPCEAKQTTHTDGCAFSPSFLSFFLSPFSILLFLSFALSLRLLRLSLRDRGRYDARSLS